MASPEQHQYTERISGPTASELREVEMHMNEYANPNNIDAGLQELAAIDPDNSIALFFYDIRGFKRVSRKEEIKLAKIVEEGREARAALERAPNKSSKQREKYEIKIQAGFQAFNTLIYANLGLPISIARTYSIARKILPDLIQAGCEGLILGAKKYDYRKGHKFSTYATWWTRKAVWKAIDQNAPGIGLPVRVRELFRKVNYTESILTQKLSRIPTDAEIALYLHKDDVKLISYLRARLFSLTSLHVPIGEEEDDVLQDITPDSSIQPPEIQHRQNEIKISVQNGLNTLPAREALYLAIRHGFIDGNQYTHAAVGRKLGITRERARQLNTQGLERLRSIKDTLILDYTL